MNKLHLRQLRVEDAPEVLSIYSPYILETAITFELEVPSLEEFTARIRGISARFPFLVCQDGGRLAGYAYAAPHNERAAYNWNATLSIYLRPGYCGVRLGQSLYGALLELLERMGYQNLYALVTLPNEASAALHKKFDFTELAVQRACGCKFGRWHDVGILEKQVGRHERNPVPPRSIQDVPASELEEVLARASRFSSYL